MNPEFDYVVIGAGPAGLSAASVAAEQGLSVALLDEQPTLGGQIYRSIQTAPAQRRELLGAEYQAGDALLQRFRGSGARHFPGTQVWSLSQGLEMGLLCQGRARMTSARQVLLATGAQERPVPFPGWTLPGVMYAGAAQILLKTDGLVCEGDVILVGTGPLLLLLGWQLQRAGVRIKALLETMPWSHLIHAAPYLPRALLAHHYVTKGLHYEWELKRRGVRVLKGVRTLRALGGRRLEGFSFTHGGRSETLAADHLLVHFGVIPHTQLSLAAGCKHAWDPEQQCWRPVLDAWGNSSVDGISIAGDGASIGGAVAARHAGCVAGFEALRMLGRIDTAERDRLAAEDQGWLRDDLRIRPFLRKLFKVPQSMLSDVPNEAIVCRCEEISAGRIRAAVDAGHEDPNQVKFLTRCGMGPCQGRQCSETVGHIIAARRGLPPGSFAGYRVRPPVKPLPIQALADLEGVEEVAE